MAFMVGTGGGRTRDPPTPCKCKNTYTLTSFHIACVLLNLLCFTFIFSYFTQKGAEANTVECWSPFLLAYKNLLCASLP